MAVPTEASPETYFGGKKITLMGLGLLGRGIGDARFLARYAREVIVTDLKSPTALAPALEALGEFKNLTFHLGGHQLADFEETDLVIKAAGVPLDSPFIAAARAAGVPVAMSTALFAKLTPATVIGVTGTRGKSTVTHLLHHILETGAPRLRSGQKNPKIFLGGNVRGMSTLELLPETKAGDLAVLELDSWQLQGFGDLKLSPVGSIVTNLLPDHLNYYGGDLEAYWQDKAHIFRWQQAGDWTVAGPEIAPRVTTAGRKIVPPPLPADWTLKLIGEHNRANAALAVAAARELDVPETIIREAVAAFPGLPGRLELVRDWQGIKIYNDTNSTTPDALRAALLALGSPSKNLILIFGGADKNLDFSAVLPLIEKYCKAVFLLPGTGSDKLETENWKPASPSGRLKIERAAHLSEAVKKSQAVATAGDVVLFSPAFASFGPPPGGFKNEYDRGEQFNQAVRLL
jgi:UDP-N-acetylmuramoylalanine--D-glutamate ligase